MTDNLREMSQVNLENKLKNLKRSLETTEDMKEWLKLEAIKFKVEQEIERRIDLDLKPPFKVYTFNTGCHYTKHGQRIAYAFRDNGDLVFLDRDRGIDGLMTVKTNAMTRHSVLMEASTRAMVLSRYLHNDYEHSQLTPDEEKALRAACDAMVTK